MNIQKNIRLIRSLMSSHRLDAFYISGTDDYLNEYVPQEDAHLYALSGFSGSTGEILLTQQKLYLFVDGRYHEQADTQCDPSLVHIVKCDLKSPLTQALEENIKSLGLKTLGFISSRLSIYQYRKWKSICRLVPIDTNPLGVTLPTPGRVSFLDSTFSGKHWTEKVQNLVGENQVLFCSKLDALSWALNLRGFQLPYHAVVKARGLLSRRRVCLFVPEDSSLEKAVSDSFRIVRHNNESYPASLSEEIRSLSQEEIIYDPRTTPVLEAKLIGETFRNTIVETNPILSQQSVKTPAEIKVFEDSFEQAGQAIFKVLSWLKTRAPREKISELHFKNKTEEYYREAKAQTQSFNTIAGFGPNGAIIHYGSPKKDYFLEEGAMALLDSGGFFSGALATDCTRTILGYGKPSPKQKLIYTLVLIGLLRLHHTTFKRGTPGKELDALARQEMLAHGFDYAHGTGHGVGINVHEGGYSLTPTSNVPLVEGKVGSLEPGIYLPGFGGVRLEDVAVVERDPAKKDHLRFRNFVFVGFDHDLIDLKLMTSEEKQWLFNYEKKCAEKGRSFLYA